MWSWLETVAVQSEIQQGNPVNKRTTESLAKNSTHPSLSENCMHVEKILGRAYKTAEGKRLENRLKFEYTPRVIQIKWAEGTEDL